MGQEYGCDWLTQGVSVGYADVYGQGLPGQEIFFSENICNGKYYIVSHFDPDSVFSEVTRANNVTAVPVYLSQQQNNCCVSNFEAVIGGGNCEFFFNDLTQPEASAWEWDFGGGNISYDQFPSQSFDSTGTYTISLTTTNDSSCTNTITKDIYIDCALVSIANQNALLLNNAMARPNPFLNQTKFSFSLDKEQRLSFELLNSNMQLVKRIKKDQLYLSGNHQIDIQFQESGIFYLNIKSDKKE